MDGDRDQTVPDVAPPQGRRAQAREEKLLRIVAAATKLFSERGFEATTTAAISEAAGIGTGTLFLYAATKEDLLVLVFREELTRIWTDSFEAVDSTLPLLDQLMGLFGTVVQVHEDDPALTRAFVRDLMFVSDAVKPGVNAFMEGFMNRLTSLLTAAQARAELAADVPVRTLAHNLYALFAHLLQQRYGGYLRLDAMLDRLHKAFELQLRGLAG